MISPTSTTTTLREGIDKQNNIYIYRVVPTDKDLAEQLRQYMDTQGIRTEKVYVCMDKASNTDAFLSAFFNDPKKEAPCNLKNLTQDQEEIENNFLKDGFNTLLLLPSKEIENALQITELLKDYPVFGNDVIFTDIPNKNIKNVIHQRLIVVAPWHPQANRKFTDKYNKFWPRENTKGSDGLNWRTGMAYDAALAITEAIRKVSLTSDIQENRQAVAKALQSVNIEGATKTIQFTEKGDRDVSVAPKGYIVRFDKNANKETYRSDFVCIEGCDQSTAPKTEPQ